MVDETAAARSYSRSRACAAAAAIAAATAGAITDATDVSTPNDPRPARGEGAVHRE